MYTIGAYIYYINVFIFLYLERLVKKKFWKPLDDKENIKYSS